MLQWCKGVEYVQVEMTITMMSDEVRIMTIELFLNFCPRYSYSYLQRYILFCFQILWHLEQANNATYI